MKEQRYFDLVYEDFKDRVKWYYQNGLLSMNEVKEIINALTDIKATVERNFMTQRQGVIAMCRLFIEYYIMWGDYMLSFDLTKGKKACYEVVIVTRDITIKLLYHYYAEARQQFTDLINQHIFGVNIWLNDLTEY